MEDDREELRFDFQRYEEELRKIYPQELFHIYYAVQKVEGLGMRLWRLSYMMASELLVGAHVYELCNG